MFKHVYKSVRDCFKNFFNRDDDMVISREAMRDIERRKRLREHNEKYIRKEIGDLVYHFIEPEEKKLSKVTLVEVPNIEFTTTANYWTKIKI